MAVLDRFYCTCLIHCEYLPLNISVVFVIIKEASQQVNDVTSTSMRCDDALKLIQRCFKVVCFVNGRQFSVKAAFSAPMTHYLLYDA